ncbi:hypothetical protein LTR86_004142 [Recurvomyces mirabilis]|nr:hypothetical protein LTR86_004142 [Recurvomyces mirabilis]
MSENSSPISPTTYRSRSGTASSRLSSPRSPGTPTAPSPYLRRMGLQVDEHARPDGTYNMPTCTLYQSEGYLERALASHKYKLERLAYEAEAENDPTGVVAASRVLLPDTPPSERFEERYGRNEGCKCQKREDGLPVGVSEVAKWPVLGCGVCGMRLNCVDPWRHDSMPGGHMNDSGARP